MTDPNRQLDPLVKSVRNTIQATGLIRQDESVLVAVSGGLDSMVLLDVLTAMGISLTVAHLNHSLRDGAAEDAAFVAGAAQRYGLPLQSGTADVAAFADTNSQSIETAARTVRYGFLTQAAHAAGASVIAVAHHADDNIETVLHRILRGTHLRGLAGMPISRAMDGTRLVRPLLPCRREELLAYARRHGLDWREDPTNLDTDFRRNFLRHELLPLLRDRLNPRVDDALLRLAETAGQTETFMERVGNDLFRSALLPIDSPDGLSLDAAVLAAGDPLVRTYAFRAALEALGVGLQAVTADHLIQLASLPERQPPAAVNLPDPFIARRQDDRVWLIRGG